MAQNVIINGVTYNSVPEVNIPLMGGGTARFMDTSDATLDNGNKMLSGVTAYAKGVKYNGTIASKAAQTYTPGVSDQVIVSGQYLSGNQTIRGDANLIAANILAGVTIFGVTGTLSMPSISQDATTKILTIA